MKKVIELIGQFFRLLKSRALPFAVAFILFVLVLFPFDDMGEFVATKVSQLTQGQVSLNFDHMGLRLFPSPGLELAGVILDTPFVQGLAVDEVGVAPDVLGFLTFRPGVSVAANGILGGDASFTFGPGPKTEKGNTSQKISLQTDGLRLAELNKAGALPLAAEGSISLDTSIQVDPTFVEQPQGKVELEVGRLTLPNAVLQTPAGPTPFPGLALRRLLLRGQLKGGKFLIEEGLVGEEGDDISGKLTGSLDLRFLGNGGNITYQMGSYTLDLNLKMKKSFEQKIDFYLALTPLKKCKKEGGGADSLYSCRVSAPNWMTPTPNIQNL